MRVPVRLPIQQVEVGPFVGPRRAVAAVNAKELLALGRRAGLSAYGGDVRDEDPLSLVFRGNLGDDVAPAIDTTLTNYYEEPVSVAPSPLVLAEVQAVQPQAYSFEPPGIPLPSVSTPPFVPSPGSTTDFFRNVATVLTAAVPITQTIAAAVRGAPATTGTVAYTLPATATAPAQRVTYNPATGQITTAPLTAPSALPGFLQAAPGAAWYQNPLVLVGGGFLAVLLIVAVSRGR